MRGDLLDLALVVLAAAFAVSGCRQGFIVGSLSFIGFVGGAVLGADSARLFRVPSSAGRPSRMWSRSSAVFAAIIGQLIMSSSGPRSGRRPRPVLDLLDSVGGARHVLAILLVAWAIGSVPTAPSFPVLVGQADNSVLLGPWTR